MDLSQNIPRKRNSLVSSSLSPNFSSSLTGDTAHALTGDEDVVTTPRQDDVPQSHSRVVPSREHAAMEKFEYIIHCEIVWH